MNYSKAKYIMGAAKVSQLPEDTGVEVAFAGRSNAGKSSALNTLTDQKGLARVSKTPGRTQLINLFDLGDNNRLVDLPGYGYAKVSESIKRQWQSEMENYLTSRKCLNGIVLLVDSRHELKEFDSLMIEMAISFDLNLHILLTKADKLNNKERAQANRMIESFLKTFVSTDKISYQLFSSLTKMGLDKFKEKLDTWYQ
ncbi:YihA family ribosome biogenesis GTP-binding protein [Francisella tularensis subsp. novicida]|uniref:ribosome biogenesis GTP-binding protein YihA/YsxC n=1 Tax=Francisella tularensis TaxID=263 RepID=UPI000158B058|nr:ribosome biogenesis GTP-binding protein YihA/YsxC [Francisella tularensis]AJI44917.1 ribosome biogenesis GTP-binding protein YsxC [Francisella tularensis subsp. novicida F6168]AJI72622.1 ribosome biogenesis GTP-binding protein YsxC [Francisella tularensis subsp. novicida D9876]AJJ47667.1 ribosome biogenesis GTP-binding protein YsxC [Francisella tularensis subsp. novicida]APC98186.1 ribosome biogenesis GTP-binding protein YsxC [Francisella tularensis subsp. novicida]EDN36383.1 ATP/GTP-bindin